MCLQINHIETLLDHVGLEGDNRQVKCSLTVVKEMGLSPAHSLKRLRDQNRHQLDYTHKTLIQEQYEGCADTAWSRY